MICGICNGIGLVRTERGTRPCACQAEVGQRNRASRMGIPPAFAGATLASFQACDHNRQAAAMARRYAADFIPGQTKTGLLFTGSTGTGKTHLAVGIARQLVEKRGVEAHFIDMSQWLDRLRDATFDRGTDEKRDALMRPIYAADLVVVDDLGVARPNDWIFETIHSLVARLYNEQKPVIVTSNLANLAYQPGSPALTLGERIGERAFSRLQEMCFPIEMTGPDWRRRARK